MPPYYPSLIAIQFQASKFKNNFSSNRSVLAPLLSEIHIPIPSVVSVSPSTLLTSFSVCSALVSLSLLSIFSLFHFFVLLVCLLLVYLRSLFPSYASFLISFCLLSSPFSFLLVSSFLCLFLVILLLFILLGFYCLSPYLLLTFSSSSVIYSGFIYSSVSFFPIFLACLPYRFLPAE